MWNHTQTNKIWENSSLILLKVIKGGKENILFYYWTCASVHERETHSVMYWKVKWFCSMLVTFYSVKSSLCTWCKLLENNTVMVSSFQSIHWCWINMQPFLSYKNAICVNKIRSGYQSYFPQTFGTVPVPNRFKMSLNCQKYINLLIWFQCFTQSSSYDKIEL